MPPFLLIVFLLFSSTLLMEVFIFTPLEFLRNLNLPYWLTVAVLVLVFSWLFGE